jgi:hypothetical protein
MQSEEVKFVPKGFEEIIGKGPVLIGKLINGEIRLGMEAEIDHSKYRIREIYSDRKSFGSFYPEMVGADYLKLLLWPEISQESVNRVINEGHELVFGDTFESQSLEGKEIPKIKRKSRNLLINFILIMMLSVIAVAVAAMYLKQLPI